MYDYTIYAYFNSEQIFNVLNAIVMLTGDGAGYAGLIKVVMSLGMFVAIVAGMARANGAPAAQYIVVSALFYSALFVPKVTCNIEEAGLAGHGSIRVVDNVPIGVAFFYSSTSKIGHWLTENVETFFAYPDDSEKFSNNGLMSKSRIMRAANTANIQYVPFAQDSSDFMRLCITPEIHGNPAFVPALRGSTDISNFFDTSGMLNAGRYVTFVSDNTTYNCPNAWAKLKSNLSSQSTNMARKISKIVNPHLSSTEALNNLNSLLPISDAMVYATSMSAQDSLRQRILINAFKDHTRSYNQILNDPAGMQEAIAAAQSEQTYASSYIAMAKVAEDVLPVARNVIEVILVAAFPIVLIIIIVSGVTGGIALKNYVQMLLWLQLWAPLYAIVHFVSSAKAKSSIWAASDAQGGISISNIAEVTQAALSSEAVAGILTIAVPFMALALIKGGEYAATSMVSQFMAPAQQAASQAGAQVGMGNVSAGNTSWGNLNSNNWSANSSKISTTLDDTGMTTQHRAAGTFITDQGGNVRSYSGANPVSVTRDGSSSLSNGSQSSEESFADRVKSAQSAISTAASRVRNLSHAERYEVGKGVTESLGWSDDRSRQIMSSFGLSQQDQESIRSSVARDGALRTEAGLDGRVSPGSLAKLGTLPGKALGKSAGPAASQAGKTGPSPASASRRDTLTNTPIPDDRTSKQKFGDMAQLADDALPINIAGTAGIRGTRTETDRNSREQGSQVSASNTSNEAYSESARFLRDVSGRVNSSEAKSAVDSLAAAHEQRASISMTDSASSGTRASAGTFRRQEDGSRIGVSESDSTLFASWLKDKGLNPTDEKNWLNPGLRQTFADTIKNSASGDLPGQNPHLQSPAEGSQIQREGGNGLRSVATAGQSVVAGSNAGNFAQVADRNASISSEAGERQKNYDGQKLEREQGMVDAGGAVRAATKLEQENGLAANYLVQRSQEARGSEFDFLSAGVLSPNLSDDGTMRKIDSETADKMIGHMRQNDHDGRLSAALYMSGEARQMTPQAEKVLKERASEAYEAVSGNSWGGLTDAQPEIRNNTERYASFKPWERRDKSGE